MAYVFERGENLLQNGMLQSVFKVKPIGRNRVTKLEFTQTKTDFYERCLVLKVLTKFFEIDHPQN